MTGGMRPWISRACEQGRHGECFARARCDCECDHEVESQERERPDDSAHNPDTSTTVVAGRVGRDRFDDVSAQDRAKHGYSSTEMCALTGLSYRQVDYWARTDILVPSLAIPDGSGTYRRYSVNDILLGRIGKMLTDAGLAPRMLQGLEAKSFVRAEYLLLGDGPARAATAESLATALADGPPITHVVRVPSAADLLGVPA